MARRTRPPCCCCTRSAPACRSGTRSSPALAARFRVDAARHARPRRHAGRPRAPTASTSSAADALGGAGRARGRAARRRGRPLDRRPDRAGAGRTSRRTGSPSLVLIDTALAIPPASLWHERAGAGRGRRAWRRIVEPVIARWVTPEAPAACGRAAARSAAGDAAGGLRRRRRSDRRRGPHAQQPRARPCRRWCWSARRDQATPLASAEALPRHHPRRRARNDRRRRAHPDRRAAGRRRRRAAPLPAARRLRGRHARPPRRCWAARTSSAPSAAITDLDRDFQRFITRSRLGRRLDPAAFRPPHPLDRHPRAARRRWAATRSSSCTSAPPATPAPRRRTSPSCCSTSPSMPASPPPTARMRHRQADPGRDGSAERWRSTRPTAPSSARSTAPTPCARCSTSAPSCSACWTWRRRWPACRPGSASSPPTPPTRSPRPRGSKICSTDELAASVRNVGYPVVGVVKGLSRAAGEQAGRWTHWGATTQDIMDTAVALQVRDGLALVRTELRRDRRRRWPARRTGTGTR